MSITTRLGEAIGSAGYNYKHTNLLCGITMGTVIERRFNRSCSLECDLGLNCNTRVLGGVVAFLAHLWKRRTIGGGIHVNIFWFAIRGGSGTFHATVLF